MKRRFNPEDEWIHVPTVKMEPMPGSSQDMSQSILIPPSARSPDILDDIEFGPDSLEVIRVNPFGQQDLEIFPRGPQHGIFTEHSNDSISTEDSRNTVNIVNEDSRSDSENSRNNAENSRPTSANSRNESITSGPGSLISRDSSNSTGTNNSLYDSANSRPVSANSLGSNSRPDSVNSINSRPGSVNSHDSANSRPASEDSDNSRPFSVNDETSEDSNSATSLPDAQIPRDRSSDAQIPRDRSTDAQVPRDRSTDEPPAKVRKISSPQNDDLDGETCPICLDPWSNSGDHRLVALKCGHLFGLNCVERWLKGKNSKERSCPTCKTKTTLKDIRFIYARRLVAADTSQITTLNKQMEQLQTEKSRVELELQKTRIAHRACLMQLEVLRSTLMKSQAPKEQPVRKSWRFALEKNLEVYKDGGCRVMTYNCRTYELYVSQKSSNNLFPGYGIRKVSCVDYKLGQFVHLHQRPIRDITYSQHRDLLLSVGLDSTARIMERGILSVTAQSGFPLWSCSWDFLRSNEFYVGGVGGVIHQYDVRNTSTHTLRLFAPTDTSPVVSLCSTEHGLLSCQLNSCWLWGSNSRQWEPRALPVEGPFMSLSYDIETHRALVSCRPSSAGERSRLAICKLKAPLGSGEVMAETEQTFFGSMRSSLMSRAAWIKAPGSSWVASHSESDSALYLHGLEGARTMSLPAVEPALDVTSVQLNGDTLLAALSESRLRLYKAVPTSS